MAEAFRAGFTRYVGPFVPDHQDIYWDPRQGLWVSLTYDKWEIKDKGLPQTSLQFFEVDSFFNDLMKEWEAMAVADKNLAFWSPSMKRWIIGILRPAPGPVSGDTGPARSQKEVEEYLTSLHDMFVKGLITYPVYLRAEADVLAGRQPTI